MIQNYHDIRPDIAYRSSMLLIRGSCELANPQSARVAIDAEHRGRVRSLLADISICTFMIIL